VLVLWQGGEGGGVGDREKYLASFHSAIVFRGTRCMRALQKMHIDIGELQKLSSDEAAVLGAG